MKIKKLISVMTAVALFASFSGCSFLPGYPTNKIVRPPRLEGEKQALQIAFEKSAGDGVLLKSPAKGEYLSSFVTYDVDGDGNEEAFVFYVDTSADASVRVNILEKKDGDWVSVGDLKGSGSSVYEIEFEDVNQDGRYEVIISWSLFDNKTTRIVSVIDFTVTETGELAFTARANEYFAYKELIDFDLNGLKELCVLYIDDTTEVIQTYLRVFEFTENNSVKLVSELPLDANIAAVSKTRKDIIKSGSKETIRLFLDVLRRDSGLFTEAVMWSRTENKLIRLLSNPSADTYRKTSLGTRDIDGDGLYEIPVMSALAGSRRKQLISGSEETNDALYIDLVCFMSLDGGKLKENEFALYNPASLYLFKFNWKRSSVTARYDEESGDTVYSEWDAKAQKYGDDLFSLNFNTKDLGEYGYTLAANAKSGNYWCRIYPAGEKRAITVKYISENLIPV